MERLAAIHLINTKARKLAEDVDGGATTAWLLKVHKANEVQLTRVTGRVQIPGKWPAKMDLRLLQAVGKYGYEEYAAITKAPELNALAVLCPVETEGQKPPQWSELSEDEAAAAHAIVKARLQDLVWMVADEYRMSHAEGTAGMLEDAERTAKSAGILEEKIERRRQMVDEWAYHEPMVGKDFQAVPPRLYKKCRVNRTSGARRSVRLDVANTESEEGRLVWDGHKHTDAVAAEWLKFVDDWIANAMTPGSQLAEEWDYRPERALELLHNNAGDVERATKSLPQQPTIVCTRKTIWQQAEIETFISAFNHYGKDFHAITAMLPLKHFKEVAKFYFDHKHDEDFFTSNGEAKTNNGYQELTTEEQQLSLQANLPAVKLLAVKKKLVAESARMGKISRKQAYEVSNIDKETTDKVYDLLVYRHLIKAAEEPAPAAAAAVAAAPAAEAAVAALAAAAASVAPVVAPVAPPVPAPAPVAAAPAPAPEQPPPAAPSAPTPMPID